MKEKWLWLWLTFICFWAGFLAGHEWSVGIVAAVHLCMALTALVLWFETKEKRPGL